MIRRFIFINRRLVPQSIKRAAPNDGSHTTVLPVDAAGASPQSLTQSSTFTNSNDLSLTHILTQGGSTQNLTQSSTFTNSNTLNYAHTLTVGPVTLTQSSTYINSNTLNFAHTLSTAITLTQSSVYTNPNTLNYAHVLSAEITLPQSSRFDNSNTLNYTHTISVGGVTLTQSSRFDNSNALNHQHVLTQLGGDQNLAANLYQNDATYYTHTLTPGEVTLTQSATLENQNTYYAHVVTGGPVTLTQSSIFTNSNTISPCFVYETWNSDVGYVARQYWPDGYVGPIGQKLINQAQQVQLYKVALLHGLKVGSPLTVTATSRGTTELTQTLSGTSTVTITTTTAPTSIDDVTPYIDDLARVYGLIDPLVISNTQRTDGTLTQTINSSGSQTTVTR